MMFSTIFVATKEIDFVPIKNDKKSQLHCFYWSFKGNVTIPH